MNFTMKMIQISDLFRIIAADSFETSGCVHLLSAVVKIVKLTLLTFLMNIIKEELSRIKNNTYVIRRAATVTNHVLR